MAPTRIDSMTPKTAATDVTEPFTTDVPDTAPPPASAKHLYRPERPAMSASSGKVLTGYVPCAAIEGCSAHVPRKVSRSGSGGTPPSATFGGSSEHASCALDCPRVDLTCIENPGKGQADAERPACIVHEQSQSCSCESGCSSALRAACAGTCDSQPCAAHKPCTPNSCLQAPCAEVAQGTLKRSRMVSHEGAAPADVANGVNAMTGYAPPTASRDHSEAELSPSDTGVDQSDRKCRSKESVWWGSSPVCQLFLRLLACLPACLLACLLACVVARRAFSDNVTIPCSFQSGSYYTATN
jgi:hypothetical protein